MLLDLVDKPWPHRLDEEDAHAKMEAHSTEVLASLRNKEVNEKK